MLQIFCALEGILMVFPATVKNWLAEARALPNNNPRLAAILEEVTPKVLSL